MFQFHFLLPEFTVLENVMIPMMRRASDQRQRQRARNGDHATTIGLGDLVAAAVPTSCLAASSSGWRSRARWPTTRRIILADEPTGNLDSSNGVIVMEVFESPGARAGASPSSW